MPLETPCSSFTIVSSVFWQAPILFRLRVGEHGSCSARYLYALRRLGQPSTMALTPPQYLNGSVAQSSSSTADRETSLSDNLTCPELIWSILHCNIRVSTASTHIAHFYLPSWRPLTGLRDLSAGLRRRQYVGGGNRRGYRSVFVHESLVL